MRGRSIRPVTVSFTKGTELRRHFERKVDFPRPVVPRKIVHDTQPINENTIVVMLNVMTLPHSAVNR